MINILLIIAYFVIVLFIGIWAARKESKEGFLIGERKLGSFSLSSSMAAGLMGGGIIVTYAAYLYQYGMSALWLVVGIMLGIFLLMLYTKQIKKLADNGNYYTLSDYLKEKYGNRVGVMSGIVVFLTFLFFLIIELIAGGRVLAVLLNISYVSAVLAMAGVVLIYLSLGGFKSVVKTDVFQYLIILVFGIIICTVVISGNTIPLKEFNPIAMGIGNVIAFVLLGAFATFTAADVWQRMYAAKSEKVAKNALKWCMVLVLVFGIAIAFVGTAAKVNFVGISPDNALVFGLTNLLPASFLGLALVMLFAAVMSSIDSALFVLGLNVSEDFVKAKKAITKKQLIKITRIAIVSFTIIAVLVAIFIQNIIMLALTFASLCLSLIPVLIGSFHFKLKEKAVFWSILLGMLSVVGIILTGELSPESAVISLPVALVTLLVGQVIFKKNKIII